MYALPEKQTRKTGYMFCDISYIYSKIYLKDAFRM